MTTLAKQSQLDHHGRLCSHPAERDNPPLPSTECRSSRVETLKSWWSSDNIPSEDLYLELQQKKNEQINSPSRHLKASSSYTSMAETCDGADERWKTFPCFYEPFVICWKRKSLRLDDTFAGKMVKKMKTITPNLQVPLKEPRNLHPLLKITKLLVFFFFFNMFILQHIENRNTELTGPAGAADQKSRSSRSKRHLPGFSVSFCKRSQLRVLLVFRTTTNNVWSTQGLKFTKWKYALTHSGK